MSADQPEALLRVEGLKTYFPVRGGVFLTAQAQCKAVDDVSIHIRPGETLGLVGESGCGKSTLGKTIVRLIKPTKGKILFDGADLSTLSDRALKPHRRQVQMIFQDPADSLNSRHSIGNILEEPFIIHGIGDASERDRRVAKLLDVVGLPSSAVERFPFEFSGGQRQRIGIARAISLNPKLVICDEPVSALDVSIQSQILNLLLDLQQEMNLSYLFIAHDLAVVKHVSDRIAIMYLGRIVEMGGADEVYERPKHPYTQALISAIPEPVPGGNRQRQILAGDVPSPIDPPSGCAFHTRCPHAQPKCREHRPELRDVVARTGDEHVVACHFDI
ncbi:MAG: dipeptide ABC transporter ATP-binding protein [Gammaproteobacteria bacterium]|jgi:oligopeptide/dipeptide ABC transporter ATP-binding protein|nr:MAG: dipeptide ABC transporter ATP-binding protein [Gammaproteobacteria bacterium]